MSNELEELRLRSELNRSPVSEVANIVERYNMNTHEGKMWNMIGAMGWVESGHNCNRVENTLMKLYNDDEIDNLRAFIDDRMTDLYHYITMYEETHNTTVGGYSSDDTFQDMVSHVVGMGKNVFDLVVTNPINLNRIHDTIFGFKYCIPHDLNLARELRTVSYHQHEAANCLDSLTHEYEITSLTNADVKALTILIERMMLLCRGDVDGACVGLGFNDPHRLELFTSFITWPGNKQSSMYASTLDDAARLLLY